MPRLQSFLPIDDASDFPLENIPFGVFRPSPDAKPRCATAVGNHVVDLSVLAERGLIANSSLFADARDCFHRDGLNAFMALGRPAWVEVRTQLQALFGAESPLREQHDVLAAALYDAAAVQMLLPCHIGDYSDFYASKEHASNVGTMFRGAANALQPNWTWIPIGYHGRASSIVVSGTPLHRPCGQLKPAEGDPTLGACRALDFELEMAALVGPGNELGKPISIDDAPNHIFGLVVMNDWSARDIQKWEYVPLGPFGAKNFGTTISPWVVTLEALEPFRCAGPAQDPAALPYLKESRDNTFDIHLQVAVQSERMDAPHVIATSNLKYMYWSVFQQLTHHTITGCNMRPGDMLGTGTISGPSEGEYGSMLELCWNGTKTVTLPTGEERKYLADGDTVVMSGYAQGDGYRIGFGPCAGRVLPAVL